MIHLYLNFIIGDEKDMIKLSLKDFESNNLLRFEIDKDYVITESEKEEFKKLFLINMSFDDNYTEDVNIGNFKIKQMMYNKNFIKYCVLNYYYVENDSLKDLLRETIIEGMEFIDTFDFDLMDLPMIYYIDRFFRENNIDKKLKIHFTSMYRDQIFGLFDESMLEDFIKNIESIMKHDIKGLTSSIHGYGIYFDVREIGKRKSMMKLMSLLMDKDFKYMRNSDRLRYLSSFYRRFENAILDEKVLAYVDNLLESKIKSLKYKEFDKKYIPSRHTFSVMRGIDDGNPKMEFQDLKSDYIVKIGEEITDENEIIDLARLNFYYLTEDDEIYKMPRKMTIAEKRNEYFDLFIKETLGLIDDNLTVKQKKSFIEDYVSYSSSSMGKESEYRNMNVLVKLSKGNIKRLIMNETVKKTFI